MNPLKKYKENRFLTQVLLQMLIYALNENTTSMNTLSFQLQEISKRPAEQGEESVGSVSGKGKVN